MTAPAATILRKALPEHPDYDPMSPAELARALADLILEATDAAEETLLDEVPDDLPDELVQADPALAVVDEAGAPITGIRLDRQPGTNRFTLVLTTTPWRHP